MHLHINYHHWVDAGPGVHLKYLFEYLHSMKDYVRTMNSTQSYTGKLMSVCLSVGLSILSRQRGTVGSCPLACSCLSCHLECSGNQSVDEED
jgi:hypothetical protein